MQVTRLTPTKSGVMLLKSGSLTTSSFSKKTLTQNPPCSGDVTYPPAVSHAQLMMHMHTKSAYSLDNHAICKVCMHLM
jgi:hypothetical protein